MSSKALAPELPMVSGLSDTEKLFRGDFANIQTNDDPILKAKGAELCQLYAPLLQDPQVMSALIQRAAQTMGREIVVTPAEEGAQGEEIANAVNSMLNRQNMHEAQKNMLISGLLFGFCPSEILWGVKDNRFEVLKLAVRKPNRFVFDANGHLALRRSGQISAEALDQDKFVIFRRGALDDDSPYGRGLGYQLYWVVEFKRHAQKWQAKLNESHGVPSLILRYPNGASQEQQKACYDAANALASNSRIVLPEGMNAELIQTTSKGETLEASLDRYDAAISKMILSQTMTSDDGSSLSQAKVHQDILTALAKEDSATLMATIQDQLVARYVAANWPNAPVPKVYRDWEEAEDKTLRAERDVKLHQIGVELTDQAISKIYGDQYQRNADCVLPTDSPTDDASNTFSETWKVREHTPLVGTILRLSDALNNSLGFEDFEGRLPEIIQETDQGLLDALSRAILNAYLAGISGLDNIHDLLIEEQQFTDADGIDYFSLSDQYAINYLKQKGFRYSFNRSDWYGKAHARAFTVAKMIDLDLLTETREELLNALENGTTFTEFKENLIPKMQKRGWWGVNEVINPETGEIVTAKLGSNARLDTIFRTNIATAHAASQWQRIEKTKDILPYLRYQTVGDGRVRDEHAAWDGIILPVDDRFWRTHYPPNGYRCRCWVQQMSHEQIKDRGLKVSKSPKITTRRVKDAGYTRNVPEGVQAGFEHNAGIAARVEPKLSEFPTKIYQDPSLHGVDWWNKFGAGLPETLAGNAPRPALLPKVTTADEAWKNWLDAANFPRNAKEITITDALGVEVILGQQLVKHLRGEDLSKDSPTREVKAKENRDRQYKAIVDTIQHADEVWLIPDPHKGSKLRQRYLKSFKGSGQVLIIERDRNGYVAITTFSPPARTTQRLRQGYPVFSAKK